MHYKAIVTVFLLLVRVGGAYGQVQVYPYERIHEYSSFSQWLKSVTAKQMEIASMLPRKERDYVTEAFTERHDFLLSLLTDGRLIFDNDLTKKVGEVYSKIEAANPSVHNIANEYVLLNPSVNAVNMGSSCILVYTGILERLQDEGQLAFVLSHELAHQAMDHVNQQIQQNAERITSKAFQDSVEKILKAQYKVITKLNNLLIPGLARKMRYSRAKELEADSLGLIYFLKAGFPAGDAIACLHLLDDADGELFKQVPDFKGYFDKDSIKFDDEWIGKGYTSSLSSLAANTKKHDTLTELLKSHPDIDVRIAALMRQMGNDPDKVSGTASSKTFSQINLIALINDAYEYYLNDNYSRAFFLDYNISTVYPDQEFPRYLNSIILSRLAILRRDHMTGKDLELQDESFQESYESTVDFLWALEEKDYARMGYWLIRPCTPDYSNDIQMTALLYSSLAMKKMGEFHQLFEHYTPDDTSSEDYIYFKSIASKK